jgi:two-component sensor histidine kinase
MKLHEDCILFQEVRCGGCGVSTRAYMLSREERQTKQSNSSEQAGQRVLSVETIQRQTVETSQRTRLSIAHFLSVLTRVLFLTEVVRQ